MKKGDRKKDILIVNLRISYNDENIYDENGNLDENEIKNCTRGDWYLDYFQAQEVQYIVGIKDREIKTVYRVTNNEPIKPDEHNGYKEIRYRFEVEDLDNETKEKIINGIYNNKVKLGQYTTMYLRSEDILN